MTTKGDDTLLTDHNEDCGADMRIRLRLAMHIGTVTSGSMGAGGEGLITVSRLLDSAPVREALVRVRDANLALILSESVFRKAVTAELGGLRPRNFQRVEVKIPAKKFEETAYLYLPGQRPVAEAASPPHAPAEQEGRPSPAGSFDVSDVSTSVGGSGNAVTVIGSNSHVHLGPEPEDAMAAGLQSLEQRHYSAAQAAFEKAARDPATTVRAHFHLAVALLAENRIRLKKQQKIRRAESALEQVRRRATNDPGALLLSAIIKEGYYQANHFDPPAQLLDLAQPRLDGADEQIALIVEHVRAEESATWRLLRAKTEGTA
jgi:hypothetical protein